MPCSGCGDDFREPEVRIEYRDNPKFKKEIDELTQMLCYVMGITADERILDSKLKNGNTVSSSLCQNQKLIDWWKKHQENDAIRLSNGMYEFIKTCTKLNKKQTVDVFIKKAENEHAVSQWHKEHFFPMCYEIALQTFENNIPVLKRIKDKITPEEYTELLQSLK
jgi:hypothetical protein